MMTGIPIENSLWTAYQLMAIHRNEIGKRNTLLGMRIQMYFKAYAKKAGIPIPAALEEQLKNAS